jgi:MoaA/NifB/PqqE/SkfB family radical SAM enzyme
MARTAKDTHELAADLWRGGLHKVAAHFPTWQVAEPEFGSSDLVFKLERQRRTIRLKVAPSGASSNLDVAILEDGGAPDVATAFARAIVVIDRARRPATNTKPQTSWREIFIADACNLKCTFCCEAVRIGRGKLMPWEQIEQTLRRYAADGVHVVQFMGGEPTIHPRFADALRLSHDLGMRNYAITNLLQWRKESFAAEVSPLLDELMISMHAYGASAGGEVTGLESWWTNFERSVEKARERLTCRIYGATVLSKHNVDDLEKIAEVLVSLRTRKWVMGNSVPIAEAPKSSLEINIGLDEQRLQMDRFRALHRWTNERGCELVFFCMPDCVLAPDLWSFSHDRMLHDQDLLGTGRAVEEKDVVFWSRTDYQDEAVRTVSLGRRYAPKCDECPRKGTCGGYFREYLDANGDRELTPESVPRAAPPPAEAPWSAYVALSHELSESRAWGPIEFHGGRLSATSTVEGRASTLHVGPGPVVSVDDSSLARKLDHGLRAHPLSWPSRDAGPLLVVTSGVPRSGTSWLMRLAIAILTGAGATLEAKDQDGRRIDDFPSNEPDDAEAQALAALLSRHHASPVGVRCVKTHFASRAAVDDPRTRFLYVYRDPRDVLVSTFHYARVGPAASHFEGRTSREVLHELVPRVVPMLRRSLEDAARADLPASTLLVGYRQLIEEPAAEIARIARHVDVHLPARFAAAIAARHSFERESGRSRGNEDRASYFRRGVVGGFGDFDPELLAIVLDAVPDAAELVRRLDARRAG